MANKKHRGLQDLTAYTEKAVRRGEKLEKTLLKLVVYSEAGSSAETLLKAVQKGVKKLKREAKELQRSLAPNDEKASSAPESQPMMDAPEQTSAKPAQKARKKASAEAVSPSEKNTPVE